MTLSDLLTYLRARKGGVYYSDVAEAIGMPILHLVRAERTTSLPNLTPDEVGRLSEYFDVPVDDLRQAQRRPRSALTTYLGTQEKAEAPAHLALMGGAGVSGPVAWRDRHAIALRQPDDSVLVVYRSAVESWGDDVTG
ncbi:MAG: hypothetical protein ACREOS_04130 [Candidatus Dormibacteraceae bacterium]